MDDAFGLLNVNCRSGHCSSLLYIIHTYIHAFVRNARYASNNVRSIHLHLVLNYSLKFRLRRSVCPFRFRGGGGSFAVSTLSLRTYYESARYPGGFFFFFFFSPSNYLWLFMHAINWPVYLLRIYYIMHIENLQIDRVFPMRRRQCIAEFALLFCVSLFATRCHF